MEKIPYETILDIQKRVNIVDIISEYLPIEQKGKNYFAICPFHDDHNPSMSISPEKQIYTCFVCGESGNVFNFVMNYEKISFTEAVLKVANKVGISLDYKVSISKPNVISKYDKFYKMFDISKKYYQNNINTVYGKSAIEYLTKRNITIDIIKEFEIGLSLNDNSLNKLLLNKGFTNEELIDIGLCGNKDNFMYDIFRNRIMFPLYNNDGKIVGFSGRIYNGENENKYVNSKESVIFKKGLLLYNYHKALEYAREKRQIIIVEGFMDVIRLYTIGIKNVVATMGTAITKEHADLIRKLSKNIILCFDGDKAGEKATISALNELEKLDLAPRIIRLEDNLDPDDYIVKKGEKAFLNHLNNSMLPLEFKLSVSKKDTDFSDYNQVSNYIKEAAKELDKIDDKIVYELTINKIAKETGVSIDTIKELVSDIPRKEKVIIDKPKIIDVDDKYKKAEKYLVYYMLKEVDAILLYQSKVTFIKNKTLSSLASYILDFYEKNHYINLTDFIVYLGDQKELINEALKLDLLELPEYNTEFINEYINTIDDGFLKTEINRVKELIKNETNAANKIALLEKLSDLKKRECK